MFSTGCEGFGLAARSFGTRLASAKWLEIYGLVGKKIVGLTGHRRLCKSICGWDFPCNVPCMLIPWYKTSSVHSKRAVSTFGIP